MGIGKLISLIKELAEEYYPIVGLISTAWAILFGHRRGLWHKLWDKIRDFWRTDIRELKRRNREFEQKLNRVRDAYGADANLWLRQPIDRPECYDAKFRQSIPILLIANLKGGVGKTTIAANLAAYFEIKRHERVLAIDIDHQGSLSSMLLPEPLNPPGSKKQFFGAPKILVRTPALRPVQALHSRRRSGGTSAPCPMYSSVRSTARFPLG